MVPRRGAGGSFPHGYGLGKLRTGVSTLNDRGLGHLRARTLVTAVRIFGPALALSASCGGDNGKPPSPPEALVLEPVMRTVQVKPGGTVEVGFRLATQEGTPVAGERLNFLPEDDPSTPGSELAGAVLSAFFSFTDASGIGRVAVTAGLPTVFRLTASQARAQAAEAEVMVTSGDPGIVAVVPLPASGSRAARFVTKIDLLLFSNVACKDLSPILPPRPVRLTQAVAPGMPAEFALDGGSQVGSAFLGQGRDAGGTLQATGCIDVPGSTVVPGGTVRVYLPLTDLIAVPRGTFLLSSSFSLTKRDLVSRVAAPWEDLGDCPLDPAQIWLDCALDALSSSAADPLDCVPAVAGAGEGELADLILARRGAATAEAPCRAASLPGGAQSLDAKVAALFPSPPLPPASEVESLAATITAMFGEIHIDSTLSLEPTATPGMFQATHSLRGASFPVHGQATPVDVVAIGTPNASVRFVPVTTTEHSDTTDDVITVDTHGLGLRLGKLAHAAFAKAALVGRGWPADTGGYLDQIFALASVGADPSPVIGCDALDVVVCAEVGRTVGCLRDACVAGQAALAARLDAGFAQADGEGADLQLSGSALLSDDNGDGFVDRLGAAPENTGLWTAQIRALGGIETVSGSWGATLQPP